MTNDEFSGAKAPLSLSVPNTIASTLQLLIDAFAIQDSDM
jgi:hypothetical protein